MEQHPFLPASVTKAFERATQVALERLADTSASKVTLPFVDDQQRAARALMGDDFWPYGLGPNRHMLEAFLARHHAEGLSSRLLTAEELFAASSLETHRI